MSVPIYCVIVEEREPEQPYGDGRLVSRECVLASRSPERTRRELQAQRTRWREHPRFAVAWHVERVAEHLADRVPA